MITPAMKEAAKVSAGYKDRSDVTACIEWDALYSGFIEGACWQIKQTQEQHNQSIQVKKEIFQTQERFEKALSIALKALAHYQEDYVADKAIAQIEALGEK